MSASAELSLDNALMTCYQALGRADDTLQCYERILESRRRNHVSDWVAIILGLKLRDLILVYWPDRIDMRQAVAEEAAAAVRLWRAGQAFGPDVPDDIRTVWLLLVDGRWNDARRVLEQAASDFWASFSTAAQWMVLSRLQGDSGEALARLPLVLPDGPRSQHGRVTYETSLHCMHPAVEVALDAGDMESARAWLACHDRWIAWSGHIPFTTIGHLLWARYHRLSGDCAAAEERAHQALALASAPRQPLAMLAAHRMLGELDTESGKYDRAHQHLTTALALADACHAPFERALTLVATADLAVARGDSDEARRLLAEIRGICEPLGAGPALEQVAALETRLSATPRPRYPAGLSACEIDVLRLVSHGLTDAQVAEQLFLSPRTVGQHLRRIYNKLGGNSRAAATRFAVEHGLA